MDEIRFQRPLSGVKVVDVTSVLMGPFATQILGDMGADIIKVEPPSGDSHRNVGQARSADLGLNFLNTGRNKRSLVLDLNHKDAREIVGCMIRDADLFVSNMRPAAMQRLGIDYASLRVFNEDLIYVSLVGFGRGGRYAGLPAYDDLIQAAVGIPWLIQHASGTEPSYVPLALCDRIVGVEAVNAILAALFARSRGAGGREIEVPMFESMARLVLGDHLGQQVYEPGTGPTGYGRLLSRDRRPYKTQDGYIAVLPFERKHWVKLFQLAGHEHRLSEFNLNDKAFDFDRLYAFLANVLLEKTSAEWIALLREAGIPAMPMNSLSDLVDDPHLADVGFFQLREHPSEGMVRMMAVPDGVTSTSTLAIRPAPRLGEHSVEILRETGLDEQRILEWVKGGAVHQHQSSKVAGTD